MIVNGEDRLLKPVETDIIKHPDISAHRIKIVQGFKFVHTDKTENSNENEPELAFCPKLECENTSEEAAQPLA